MYTRSMGLLAVLMACAAVAVLQHPALLAQETRSSETIAALAERVKELEARVGKLEKSRQILAVPAPGAELPQPPQGPQGQQQRPDFRLEPSLPKGWQRREFNGVPYYIIPAGFRQQFRLGRNAMTRKGFHIHKLSPAALLSRRRLAAPHRPAGGDLGIAIPIAASLLRGPVADAC